MLQRTLARDVNVVAALLLSAALSACTAELSIPDDAQLDCSASACPAGWTCTPSKRCVPSSAIDVQPPAIAGAPLVDPPTSKAGVSPQVTFTVTEALLHDADPVVRVAVGTTRLLTKVSGHSPGLTYVYEYASQGDEPQGSDCPITVDLVDTQGVTSTGLAAGSLRFDDVPPETVTSAVPAARAKSGATVKVTFTVSEPLKADPVVRAGGTLAFTKDAASSGQAYVYVRVSDGTEPQAPGGLPVTADLVDLAGNPAAVDVGTVVFDRTAPGLTTAPEVLPLSAAHGTLVKVTFTADEDLGVDPVVTLGGVVMEKGAQAGRLYTFGHVADPADGEGSLPLAITLTDLAGNGSGPLAGPAVTFDFTSPAVNALAACADDGTSAPCAGAAPPFSAQPGHDRVKLTFTLSEPGPRPVVSVAGAVLGEAGPDSCHSADGLAWTCTSSVVDAAAGANPRVLSVTAGVTAADAAGNSTFQFTLLTWDFRPPGLAGTPYFERCDAYAPARLGANDLWVKPVASFAGPGCPFSACGVSGPVRVQLTLDEAVTLGPGGIALDDGTRLQLDTCASNATQLVAVLGADGAPGARSVVADVRDAAGNARQLGLGQLRLDATQPVAPDTVAAGRIVYDRFPWGADATQGAKASFLRGAAGAVAPGASVVVYDGPSPATAAAVGRTTADGTGAFGGPPGTPAAFALAAADVPELFVVQEDPAGNPSPAALVWDGRWTATTGFKQVGSTAVNPNLFTVEPAWRESRWTAAQREPADPTAAAAVTGPGVVTTGGPDPRQVAGDTTVPGVRGDCAMDWDPDLGRGVMFGGRYTVYAVGNFAGSDTWEWSGGAWRPVDVPDQPPARFAHGLAYDGTRRRFVMFGGSSAAGTLFGDTWELDGSSWRRVCWPGCTAAQCSCTTMPTPRSGAATFHDPVTGKVIVAGGTDASGARNDTWSWDGSDWTPLAPATSPPAISGAKVAVSPELGVTMIAGGAGTWSWDGSTWTGSAAAPFGGAIWWDPGSGKFYSYSPFGKIVQIWSGSSWDMVGTPPFPSVGDTTGLGSFPPACGVFDRELEGYVAFGGCIDSSCRADYSAQNVTGFFTSQALRLLTPGYAPGPRYGAALADFTTDGVAWLYGGASTFRYAYADNWIWDGATWRTDGLGSPMNGNVYGATDGTVYASMSPSGGRLMRVFGSPTGGGSISGPPIAPAYHESPGYGWSWWGGDWSVYVRPITNTMPDQAMAFDDATARAVFFQVPDANPTWTLRWVDYWDPWFMHGPTAGPLWEPVTTATTVPSSLNGHRMASCPGAIGVVLFGGVSAAGTYLDEMFTWSGTDWLPVLTTPRPQPRAHHAMFCDRQRGKLLVVGGEDASGNRDDVWEWDGTTWRERDPAERPSPRHGQGASWYSGGPSPGLFGLQGNPVLQGGLGNGFLGETWLWDGGRDRRPAHLFHARFADAATGAATLKGVSVAFWSGGTAYSPAGATLGGVQLQVRDRGIWRPVSNPTTALASTPAPISWSTDTDPEWTAPGAAARLRRLLAGDDLTATFLVAPVGTNRDRSPGASLATRYAEVQVRYRLACLAAGRTTTSAQRCCSGVKAGTLCQ